MKKLSLHEILNKANLVYVQDNSLRTWIQFQPKSNKSAK